MVCRLYNDSFIRAAGVFIILRPFLLLFRLLRHSILTATLTPFFLLSISHVREISLLVLVFEYISIKHRPPERAQRASLTSSVHSYLRWILTATSPTIYYSFYFTCSRDFIVSIMVLWYYELVFEYINLSNIDCGSECQSERSERL